MARLIYPVISSLAAQAIEAGLVDEYHLFLVPMVVGGGKRSLPDSVGLRLELLDGIARAASRVDGTRDVRSGSTARIAA